MKPASLLPLSAPSTRQTPHSKEGVQSDAQPGHNPPIKEHLVIGAAHGAQKAARKLAPLCNIQQLRTADMGLQLRDIPLSNGKTLLCVTSTNRLRPLVPLDMRQLLHSFSHPGIGATQRLVKEGYVWPFISSDVRCWTKACMACQSSKILGHTKSPVGTFLPQSARFDHVHIHIVGLLPPSEGLRHLLTIVDCSFSGQPLRPI
ncbi:pol Pro-Pol polyprotein-like 1 [Homarus americanus]|uniref:Pol Pro-Pol polyprotein-like 1 n=1 Tax=Homarus americanus TaxID=6706 RepID=A0A8J5T6N2_HOMAM|nr:pol Pro-Pol polyprotein-like 1 [Homarus americanus]